MEKNQMDHALVTSISGYGSKETGSFHFRFIPAACYAYTVGENTRSRTKESFGL